MKYAFAYMALAGCGLGVSVSVATRNWMLLTWQLIATAWVLLYLSAAKSRDEFLG